MKRFDKVTGAALSLTGVTVATAIGVGVTRAAQGPEAPTPAAAIEAAASVSPSPSQPSGEGRGRRVLDRCQQGRGAAASAIEPGRHPGSIAQPERHSIRRARG